MFTRLSGTIALLVAAAALAGIGTYATFTSSANVDQSSVQTGKVAIALGAVGAANRLTLGASGLLPGDTMQRVVDLTNNSGGSDPLASITLTTTASPSSLLDTDATNGLQMAIDSCTNPWTETGTSPAFTYTCGGTSKSVLATRAVVGADMALSNLTSLTSGATDHLRVTLSLPSSAPGTMQALSSTLAYVFTGTQRAGTAK